MVLFHSLLGTKGARTNSRTRLLGFDHLERRELLTTIPMETEVETALVTLAEPVPSEVASLAPSNTESTYSQFSDEGGGGGGGGEEVPSTPPFLFDFTWTSESNYYIFTGSVIDDEDPFQLTVYFGGIISGNTCTVNYDGTFSFSIELESPSGMVTAIVQDGDGLWSNQAWTCL